VSKEELSATQNFGFGSRLSQINSRQDIPEHWLNTPIEDLIGAHNFQKPIVASGEPALLIVTCIEYRFQPEIPNMWAYVNRCAGGRLAGSEFSVSYILAKGVRHIALIGHNDCGMTKVVESKPLLIEALVSQRWERDRAEDFVEQNAARFMMQDEIDGQKREFLRLRQLFPEVEIAPLFVSIASMRLHIPKWYFDYLKASPESAQAKVRPEDLLML
jgi:carbonic anhydrase